MEKLDIPQGTLDLMILTILTREPLHGYGIIREVETLSKQRVKLLPGTLYTALDRLAAQGIVEREREEVLDGRLRRYYRLTNDGRAVLDGEAVRLRELATAAEQRLSGSAESARDAGRSASPAHRRRTSKRRGSHPV